MNNGKKNWYIVDGWMPSQCMNENSGYEGHECLMILNCNEVPAEVYIDVYFEDKPPMKDIKFIVEPERIKSIRMDKPEQFNGIKIDRLYQYSLRVRSNVEVVVQFGRMDVTQPNCAYIGLMGYSE